MFQRLTLTALAVSLVAARAAAGAAAAPTPPVTVALAPRLGSELDATARRLVAADLREDPRALLLIGSERLGRAGAGPALFVQLQSRRACGSAGCATSVFLPVKSGWTRVLDAVSGSIAVAAAEHDGMHDLLVGKNDRFVWNGKAYADTQPAPQVDLRPRKPGRGHRAG